MSEGTGAWFVSQAAKDTFVQLKDRWAKLDSWGVRSKVPKIREIVDIWDRFRAKWEDGDEDVDYLGTAATDLEMAERYAAEKGYGKPKDRVVPPDITGVTSVRSGAQAVHEEVTHAERAAAESVEKIPGGAGTVLLSIWRGIPTDVKALAAGGAVLVGAAKLYFSRPVIREQQERDLRALRERLRRRR